MRVIAGSARRLSLKTIDGSDTRPTTDRLKETLFNMIHPRLPGTWFLDLFSGSGGIGIEALSRGACHAAFIEQNPKAAACIRQNLIATHLEENSQVMCCDVITGLKKLEESKAVFHTVFMDPPYDQGKERLVLEYLKNSRLIDKDTILIIEASFATDFSYLETLGFSLVKSKEYKTNKHVFIAKEEA